MDLRLAGEVAAGIRLSGSALGRPAQGNNGEPQDKLHRHRRQHVVMKASARVDWPYSRMPLR